MNKQKRCCEIFRFSEEMPVYSIYVELFFLSKRVVKLVTLSL